MRDGERSVTAYGLDRLERRWSGYLDAGGEFQAPVRCGDSLCLFGRQGGVRAIDPVTGRTRWRDPRWSAMVEAGGFLLATPPRLALGPDPLTVLDPATGRTIGDLGRWNLVGPLPGGPLIGVRPAEPTRSRVLVAELDPATLSVTHRGTLLETSTNCDAHRDVLVCRRLDGSFGVWRLT